MTNIEFDVLWKEHLAKIKTHGSAFGVDWESPSTILKMDLAKNIVKWNSQGLSKEELRQLLLRVEKEMQQKYNDKTTN